MKLSVSLSMEDLQCQAKQFANFSIWAVGSLHVQVWRLMCDKLYFKKMNLHGFLSDYLFMSQVFFPPHFQLMAYLNQKLMNFSSNPAKHQFCLFSCLPTNAFLISQPQFMPSLLISKMIAIGHLFSLLSFFYSFFKLLYINYNRK